MIAMLLFKKLAFPGETVSVTKCSSKCKNGFLGVGRPNFALCRSLFLVLVVWVTLSEQRIVGDLAAKSRRSVGIVAGKLRQENFGKRYSGSLGERKKIVVGVENPQGRDLRHFLLILVEAGASHRAFHYFKVLKSANDRF